MRTSPHHGHPGAGFSIIELSIVMVIIGIILSLGITALGPSVQSAAETKNKARLQAAVETLKGFAAINRAIPVSADFASVVNDTMDAYGVSFRYLKDNNFISSTGNSPICNRASAGITVQIYNDAATPVVTQTINNVVLVVTSKGNNGKGQLPGANADTTAPTSPVNLYPFKVTDIDGEDTADSTEFFDDQAAWVTLSELKTAAGCIGPALTILNNTLPDAKSGTGNSYLVNVFPQGGIADGSDYYSWCVVNNNSVGSVGDLLINHVNMTLCATDSDYTCVGSNLLTTIYPTSVSPNSCDDTANRRSGAYLRFNNSNIGTLNPGVSSFIIYVYDSAQSTASKTYAISVY